MSYGNTPESTPAASSRTVLLTGAWTLEGAAVARQLLGRGHQVLALTPTTGGYDAGVLADLGVPTLEADWNDVAGLAAAFGVAGGVDAVYLVTSHLEGNTADEVGFGVAVADAAKAAGVGHFIVMSVADANLGTGVPHYDSKFAIERHVADVGIPYTVIAPAFLRENILAPNGVPATNGRGFALALPANRAIAHVAVDEVAQFAVHVIEGRDRFLGERVAIASDELPIARMAEIVSRMSGFNLPYNQASVDEVRATSENAARMYEWTNRGTTNANPKAVRSAYGDVDWKTFEQWAAAQDWSALNDNGRSISK